MTQGLMCLQALKKVPGVNSSWHGDFIRQYHNIDISIAVQTPNGLMVPVVRDSLSKGLTEIGAAVKALAGKVSNFFFSWIVCAWIRCKSHSILVLLFALTLNLSQHPICTRDQRTRDQQLCMDISTHRWLHASGSQLSEPSDPRPHAVLSFFFASLAIL